MHQLSIPFLPLIFKLISQSKCGCGPLSTIPLYNYSDHTQNKNTCTSTYNFMSDKYIYDSGRENDVYVGESNQRDIERRNLIGHSDVDSRKNGTKTVSRFKKIKEQLLGKSDRPSSASGGGGGCFCFMLTPTGAARRRAPKRPKSFTIKSLKGLIEKEKSDLFATKFNASMEKRGSSSRVWEFLHGVFISHKTLIIWSNDYSSVGVAFNKDENVIWLSHYMVDTMDMLIFCVRYIHSSKIIARLVRESAQKYCINYQLIHSSFEYLLLFYFCFIAKLLLCWRRIDQENSNLKLLHSSGIFMGYLILVYINFGL